MDGPRSLLLFSGTNDRAVHALARAAIACSVRYQVIASGLDDRILQGSHRRSVCAVRSDAVLSRAGLAHWISLAREAAPQDRFVVAPTSEYLNRFLLGLGQEQCDQLGIEVPLTHRALYEQLTNKASATALFAANGIRVPAAAPDFSASHLPLVAKPKRNSDESGRTLYPRLLLDELHLAEFLSDCNPELFFAQQYVSGRSHYLLAYFPRTGEPRVTSQVNLAQQPGGKSILLARTDDFHRSSIAERSIRLLVDAGFTGLGMIEFIDSPDGPCFIEMNPRPWGPIQLCVDHRCGVLEAFLGETVVGDARAFDSVTLRKRASSRYLWLGGFREALAMGGNIKWAIDGPGRRMSAIAGSIGRDVYLRRDSWRIFLRETIGSWT